MSDNNSDIEKTPLKKSSKVSVENAKLNDFFQLGRYTLLIAVWLVIIILNQLGHAIYMMFAGTAPKLISCGDHDFSNLADSVDACLQLKDVQNLKNCTPEFSAQFVSVNYEFGYYCEATKIVKSSITYQMVGLIIGAMIFGQLSDNYGRKPTLLCAIFFSNIFNVLSSYTDSLLWFTVLRFFVNLFNAGSIAVSPIYSMELLPVRHRYWINNVVGGAPVFIAYAIIAYYSQEWRTLARVSSFLVIPGFILSLFINESPRYLIQKGRITDAKKVIKLIHTVDGREFDEYLVDHVLEKENHLFLENQSKNKNYTITHLFCTPNLTRYSLAIALSFFVTSALKYALMFNLENIAGSIYINLCLTGVVRYIVGGLISVLEVKCAKVGRKALHFGILFVAMICFAFYFVVILLGYETEFALILRIFTLAALGFIGQMYLVNGVAVTELFPTCIRNLAYSFGQFTNRIGVTMSPQIFLLADYWKPLPYLTMFCVVMVDMFFFQFNVKETKNNPLGDHMPGVEETWSYRRNLRKNRKARATLESMENNNKKLIKSEDV